MKVLILGKNGQVGWELQRSLQTLGDVVALGSTPESELSGNLLDIDNLRKTIRAIQPSVIVNAGAYTAVDKAESEPEVAFAINGVAPGVLAEEAKRLDALLVHYSTDYVFDGSGTKPWTECDKPAPLNVYGQSKLAGEEAIQNVWDKHLIFRTSWVYGVHGNNFIKTMLRLAQERESLNIVEDQVGSPTSAKLIADVTAAAIAQLSENFDLAGLYHLSGRGEASWFSYAQFILNMAEQAGYQLKVQANDVKPIPSSAYPVPALRPKNSRLDCGKLTDRFSIQLPEWQLGVESVISASRK